MRRIMKWLLRLGMAAIVLMIGLLLPVAYVEFACRVDAVAKPNQSVLADQYKRLETRTLMTYPEWHIVHAYEDYAEVIREGAPHNFDYWASITGYWSSLCSLTKSSASLGPVDTETKQLVYVIGTSFTVELALKAVYEETIGRVFVWFRGVDQSPLDKVSADQAIAYAKFLQQVPWYKWDFDKSAAELHKNAPANLRDHERQFALGLEYKSKAAYAGIIAQAVASTGADELTLRMVVSSNDSEELKLKLASYEGVQIIEWTEAGAIVEAPRYRQLTRLLQTMALDDLEFIEIAGNDQIMFTVLSTTANYQNGLATMKRQGFDDHRHLVLVDISDLASALRNLTSSTDRLEHIHDY